MHELRGWPAVHRTGADLAPSDFFALIFAIFSPGPDCRLLVSEGV
jgi:hypothetical protein